MEFLNPEGLHRNPAFSNVAVVSGTVRTIYIGGQDFATGYAAFHRVWGDQPNPPVITAAVVKGLARPDLLVEMDAIAVVPA